MSTTRNVRYTITADGHEPFTWSALGWNAREWDPRRALNMAREAWEDAGAPHWPSDVFFAARKERQNAGNIRVAIEDLDSGETVTVALTRHEVPQFGAHCYQAVLVDA